jgi:hypothetical protein
MRREVLLLGEMIDAARAGTAAGSEHQYCDTPRRFALATSPSSVRPPPSFPRASRSDSPRCPGGNPSLLRNRIVHGYWSIDMNVRHTTAQDQLRDFTARLGRVMSLVVREEANG